MSATTTHRWCSFVNGPLSVCCTRSPCSCSWSLTRTGPGGRAPRACTRTRDRRGSALMRRLLVLTAVLALVPAAPARLPRAAGGAGGDLGQGREGQRGYAPRPRV